MRPFPRGVYTRIRVRRRTRIYNFIYPYPSLYPYTHADLCAHIHTATYTYLEAGMCRDMAMCVCMCTLMCGYMQLRLYAGIGRDRYIDTNRGRHRHTAFHVYAPGAPLRGKRSGGGCQEQLNVCLIV